mgnify:CR=1 FL=1
MKKTIIEEYDSNGKLIKKTTIEEDPINHNGMYNPYNPVVTPLSMKKYLDGTITCTASDTIKATLKGE